VSEDRDLREARGEAVGFSLWLVPEEPIRAQLSETIRRLALRLGTPAFEPHVTLLGGLLRPEAEVVSKAEALARLVPRLELRVSGVEGRDEYFRCLFLRVEDDPALLDAHSRALAVFGRAADRPLLPHLSLVYGRLGDEEKRTLIAEIDSSPSFEVAALEVHETEGPPVRWHRAARLPVGLR
jgi:2'-5' RNA ligase